METVPNKTVQIKTSDPEVCALEKDEVKCSFPGCSGPYCCEKRKDQWDSKN